MLVLPSENGERAEVIGRPVHQFQQTVVDVARDPAFGVHDLLPEPMQVLRDSAEPASSHAPEDGGSQVAGCVDETPAKSLGRPPPAEPIRRRRAQQIRDAKCERGDLNPHGCLAHRILNPID